MVDNVLTACLNAFLRSSPHLHTREGGRGEEEEPGRDGVEERRGEGSEEGRMLEARSSSFHTSHSASKRSDFKSTLLQHDSEKARNKSSASITQYDDKKRSLDEEDGISKIGHPHLASTEQISIRSSSPSFLFLFSPSVSPLPSLRFFTSPTRRASACHPNSSSASSNFARKHQAGVMGLFFPMAKARAEQKNSLACFALSASILFFPVSA
mmetsp:Transcript_29321/g.75589  ORF Transcript_29321/g.75589 Transcript_29321/m.75589 type:complete len:211 (+) Transcript_29321:833-1465(+)